MSLAGSALAAPVIVNDGTYTSGNASFEETGAIENSGNSSLDATFLVNVDSGQSITGVTVGGQAANIIRTDQVGTNTFLVSAWRTAPDLGGFGCSLNPFGGNRTRRLDRNFTWTVRQTNNQTDSVTQNVKIIADDQCTAATDYPVLEASGHVRNDDLAPGGSVGFSFTCDDADGSGSGDACEDVIVRWRNLGNGDTQSEGTFDACDNCARSYTASAPNARGVWVLEGQLRTEDGVEDSDWWRLGHVRINNGAPSAGSISFSGANASSPPSVNQGGGITAIISGYSSDVQLIQWAGTTNNALSWSGSPGLSGGNVSNPTLTSTQTQRTVDTSSPGLKTISATVTDNGAIDAADNTRRTGSTSAQLRVNARPVANAQTVAATEDEAESITLTSSDSDNQPLSAANRRYIVVDGPDHGSLSGGEGATRTYTPAANYAGPDSFTFKVADGPSGNSAYAESATVTVTIDVAPVNDAPIAGDLELTTPEDTPKQFFLPVADIDGPSVAITITDPPAHGELSCTGVDCTYTPDQDFFGDDSFTYSATDGSATDHGTVTIEVTEGNDPPVANAQSASTDEDTAVEIALDAADPDGQTLTATTTDGPDHGSVTYDGLTATYTPAPDFHGTDAFTYEVSDGAGGTDTATVTITVASVNDAPVAEDQMVGTDEDTPVALQLSGQDADGDGLAFQIADGPAHGDLDCDGGGGACTYTPDANFHGTDSFTFTAADDNGGTSAPATVTVIVAPVNDAPVAGDQSASTDEDTAAEIALDATDADGDALTATTTDGPDHGTVTYDGLTATYTPAPDFSGTDAFTYAVSDGNGGTDTATVTITVAPVNDAPVALAQSVPTDEDTPAQIQLTGNDADGDDLTFAVGDQPEHGTVTCNGAGACTYTPDANFYGTDSFTFTATDGTASSEPATVDVLVAPVNDAPTAQDAEATTEEDTAVEVELDASDVDGDTLTFAVGGTAPSKGSATFDGSTLTYTPAANVHGSDEFTVVVSDGNGGTDELTVSITITPVNDAPTANTQMVSVNEDGLLLIELDGTDVDGDPLTFSAPSDTPHGQLQCTATSGICAYSPDDDYHGPDGFEFTVSDGTATSAPAQVDIIVVPVNDAPDIRDETVQTDEDQAVDVALDVTDVDGDDVTLSIGDQPQHGTVTLDGTTATYTPAADFHGQDEFTVVASDGNGGTDEATVKVTVRPVNDAPTADGQMVSTDEDTPLGIQLGGGDLDGDELTFEVDDEPGHGSVTCDDAGACTYTPAANFHGTDAFTFRVSDGEAESAEATVEILVRPVNDDPTVQDATATTDEDTATEIDLEASDVDGDALTFAVGEEPEHGSVSFDGATATYTPAADFHGSDEFTVVVSDGNGGTATATVKITVEPVNDVPTIEDASATTAEDTAVEVELTAADLDGDELSFEVTDGPAHGTTSVDGATVTYTPAADFHGTDAFEVTVSDGHGGSATATVSVTVTPVNDAPTVEDATATTEEDTAVEIELEPSDVDGDALTFAVGEEPEHGSVSFDGATVTYTPAAGFHGEDEFTVVVSDGNGGTATATVRVTVEAVNDAPTVEDASATTQEDTAVDVALTVADADGDALTIEVTGGPVHGTTSVDGATVTYTPAADFHGSDEFEVTVSDGNGGTATATVSVTVTPVNDAPTVEDATATTAEDTAVEIGLEASDVEGDALTFAAGEEPEHGTVTFDGATATYTPAADFHGEDEFTVVVSDGNGGTATATVKVTVTPVNDAPTVQDATLTTDEDTAGTVALDVADADGDALDVQVTGGPAHGTTSVDGTAVTYTPAADFHGSDAFEVTVSDGNGGTATATVTVTVAPVNDAPTAAGQTASTSEDTAVEIELDVADIDGDALTATATDGPDHGTVTFDGTTATYTPAADFHGDDAFTYEVSDGHGGTAQATVTITVGSVNDAPSVQDATATTPEDTSVAIPITATDADGDALTYSATQPEGGSVTCSDGTCTFVPAANFHGTTSFEVTVEDPSGAQDTATVTVTVTPVNDAPVAEDLQLSTQEDTQLGFTLQAADVDGDTLTYAVSDPPHGSVSCVAQACQYLPDADFHGTDEFTYTVNDGHGGTDTATIRIEVGEVSYATKVTAEPMVSLTQKQSGSLLGSLGVTVRLFLVRAQLTRADTGAPVAGETIVFRAGSTELCRATTNAQGWAQCQGPQLTLPAALLAGNYTATFAGDPDLHPSQGSAAGLKLL